MKTNEIIDKKIRDLPLLIDNNLNSTIIPSVEMAKEVERFVKSILNQLKQEIQIALPFAAYERANQNIR